MSDVIISLDDKYLYVSLWMFGELRQYDISDPAHPKLTALVQLGGIIASDPDIKVLEDKELKASRFSVLIAILRIYRLKLDISFLQFI